MTRDIRLLLRTLESPHATVKVRRDGNAFIVDPKIEEPVIVVKAGTKTIPLDTNERVVDPDGNEVPATGRFYRSTETIDPFHLIFGMF